ncbi:P22 phage major capsid protein family protein [Canibacter oris]|uniref:N4-gp56 family major capsid protein n=1 Tax=Canibacter oris TaxID=1365628 RepID=A0A840DKQ5_9MICO|nr:P22 phage major capsid protein family protein [Canibacter oris]MBB4072052.1 N4-gp56 family major capsid protein [Canibacter oris]
MALDKFVPEVWAAQIITELEKAHVFGSQDTVNRDYEGEIANFGDTVHITSLADPTIGTYTSHADISIEQVSDSDQTLIINQSKYFAFEVDDIEKRQARGNVLEQQARRAAYKLRDTSDTYIASVMSANVHSGNQLGQKTLSTPDAAYDLLVDLAILLDESDVPTEGRFAIITPKMHGLLQKDKRFIAAGDSGGEQVRANGHIGRAAGLAIKVSNNVATGSGSGKMLVAGSPIATTYAEQIAKVEALRMEKRFADAVKGLHLYGCKVVRPKALASVEVTI